MRRRTLVLSLAAGLGAAGAIVGCATAPSDSETTAKAAAMLKSSFKERGQAKLDRLDQDETQKICSSIRGQGAAEGRRGAHREGQPRDGQMARRRQVPRRLEERREDRAGGPRQAVFRRPRRSRRRQLLCLPSARPEGSLLRHDRPEPLPVRQDAWLRARDAEICVRKGLQPGRLQCLHQHAALRPQRDTERAAGQGRRRAADGSRFARQQVARR